MKHGFLIASTYESMYQRFDKRTEGVSKYALPRKGWTADRIEKKYRGIARDVVEGWVKEDIERGLPFIDPPLEPKASEALGDLEERGAAEGSVIREKNSARAVFGHLREPENWELIWAGLPEDRPEGGRCLGWDVCVLGGENFSAICDSMCFPRWHGTDKEGRVFLRPYSQLNEHALFNSVEEADDFERFYTGLDWTERGDFRSLSIYLM